MHLWWLVCGGHAFLGRDLTLEIGDTDVEGETGAGWGTG